MIGVNSTKLGKEGGRLTGLKNKLQEKGHSKACVDALSDIVKRELFFIYRAYVAIQK